MGCSVSPSVTQYVTDTDTIYPKILSNLSCYMELLNLSGFIFKDIKYHSELSKHDTLVFLDDISVAEVEGESGSQGPRLGFPGIKCVTVAVVPRP